MTTYINHSNMQSEYTRIPNKALQDDSLTWGARGILAYLLSRPNNWTMSKVDLVRQSPDGRVKVDNYIKELVRKQYLKRVRITGLDNKFSWETHVWDTPQKGLNYDNGKWKEFYKKVEIA